MTDRAEKLRRMADPSRNDNSHERAVARAALDAMRGTRERKPTTTKATAHVRVDGEWLLVTVPVEHDDFAKAVAMDAFGAIGAIKGELALWLGTAEEDSLAWMADALRCNGFEVTTGARMRLA